MRTRPLAVTNQVGGITELIAIEAVDSAALDDRRRDLTLFVSR